MKLRLALAALAFVCAAPLAHAQIVIQTPGLRVEPERRDQRVAEQREEYWRQRRENERESEWRRREEFREQEHRKVEWQREHCVRNWQGQEYCRR